MPRALPILAGLAVTLGLVHLGLSVLAWRNWTPEALWFAGSGLAIVTAGLFNVAMIRADAVDRTQRGVWLGANLAMTGFFLAAWPVLKQPQVIVGGAIFALLCVAVVTARGRGPTERIAGAPGLRDAGNV